MHRMALLNFEFDWFISQIQELGGSPSSNIYYKYLSKYLLFDLFTVSNDFPLDSMLKQSIEILLVCRADGG